MNELYTDRRDGPLPRTESKISPEAWCAFASLIRSRLNSFAFGYAFPERCRDPHTAANYGCHQNDFFSSLRAIAEFPNLHERFDGQDFEEPEEPPTDAILDGLEWCATKLGKPEVIQHHPFYSHDHLKWDHERGLQEWVSDVNQIFSRQGLAYEMDETGKIHRVVEGPVAETLARTLFQTGDADTDELLERARKRFFDRDVDAGQYAIMDLWDAFERLKTLLDADKKVGAAVLLEQRTTSKEMNNLIEIEMKELTEIGNQWRIRHHETDKASLGVDRAFSDYLFLRMFSLIWFLLSPELVR